MAKTYSKNASDKLREYNARRKKKYKRRRKAAVYLILLLFVCVVSLILSLTVFFNATEIKVVGNVRYTVDQVVTASGLETGDNLLRLNKSSISEKMLKQLPYAADIKIIRELPSIITIKITEAEPACYYVMGESTYALLSSELRVMEIVNEEPENTAVLSGITMIIPETGEIAKAEADISEKILLDLLTELRGNDIMNISNITFSGAINVSFVVDGRITAKIGGNSDLSYKLDMVKTYLRDCLPQIGEWTIDVSSGDKLYASRTKVSSAESDGSSEESEESESGEEDEVSSSSDEDGDEQ